MFEMFDHAVLEDWSHPSAAESDTCIHELLVDAPSFLANTTFVCIKTYNDIPTKND